MGKRFEINDYGIKDTEKGKLYFFGRYTVCDLLNEQDEKIKELESQVSKWKQNYEDCYKQAKLITKERDHCRDNWIECVEKYKQSQNQKAIEVLENIKIQLREKVEKMQGNEHCYPQNAICWEDVVAIISNQSAELRGEK